MCLIGLAGSLLGSTPGLARLTTRTSFRDKSVGIQMFLPGRWVRQVRSALPGVLATFKHPFGARFVLAAKHRHTDKNAEQRARRNARQLQKLGWRLGPITQVKIGRPPITIPATLFVVTDAKGRLRIRQIHAVRGKYAYILTLVSPIEQSTQLLGDLRFVLKSTRFAR